jgi:hypothetical protein
MIVVEISVEWKGKYLESCTAARQRQHVHSKACNGTDCALLDVRWLYSQCGAPRGRSKTVNVRSGLSSSRSRSIRQGEVAFAASMNGFADHVDSELFSRQNVFPSVLLFTIVSCRQTKKKKNSKLFFYTRTLMNSYVYHEPIQRRR